MGRSGTGGRGYAPLLVLLYFGFLEFAYAYLLCHVQIGRHLKKNGVAIALIVIFNVLLFLTLTVWVLLLTTDPGEIPLKVKPYDLERYVVAAKCLNSESPTTTISVDDEEEDKDEEEDQDSEPQAMEAKRHFSAPPDIFPCDINGLPAWCFECHTIKVLRSSHSGRFGKCVPKFDHNCQFIGTLISKQNFPYFAVYVTSIWGLFLMTITTLGVYTSRIHDFHSKSHEIHPAFIVAYIMCGIWLILLCNLVWTIVMLAYTNETTLDSLKRNQMNRKFKREWNDHIGGNRNLLLSSLSLQKMKEKQQFIECRDDPMRRYFSVLHPVNHNLRYIVRSRIADYPYNKGLVNNLKEMLWKSHFEDAEEILRYESDSISKEFKDFCHRQIENGDAILFGSVTINPIAT